MSSLKPLLYALLAVILFLGAVVISYAGDPPKKKTKMTVEKQADGDKKVEVKTKEKTAYGQVKTKSTAKTELDGEEKTKTKTKEKVGDAEIKTETKTKIDEDGNVKSKTKIKGDGDLRHHGIDANNDGRITRGEFRGNDSAFSNLDWNRDGILSGEELRPGAHPFVHLDHDNDGRVTRGEWNGDVAVFNRLDRNRDDKISRDEFFNRLP